MNTRLFETRFKRFRYWNGFEQGGGSSREAQGRRNLFERHYRRGDSNFVFYSKVAFSFGIKKFVTPEELMNVKIIVLRDTQVPVLIATLRWIYEIPVQPSQEILADTYRLGS